MAEPKKFDMINRGSYGSDMLGNVLMVGLRALDPWLQRQMLLKSPLSSLTSILGLRAPGPPIIGGAPLSSTGLTPFQTVIWAMSIGSAAKHILWKLVVAKEPVYPSAAVGICVFNTIFNSLNTLAYNASGENPAYFPPWSVYIGTALYISGILTETISEIQRSIFKNDPKSDGKVYTGGLFLIVRHVSYTGYSMWRAGYAMAAGGPIWGIFVGGWFLRDFSMRAIPLLDEYMAKKYGEQWSEVKKKVPYALVPGIW